MPRAGLPRTPPNPIVDVVTHFLVGVLLGPAATVASAVCVAIYTLYSVTGTGSSNPANSVSDVIFEIVGFLLPCALLGAATYSLFKRRSGRPLPFATGVGVAFVTWGIIQWIDEKDAALLFRHVATGLVLAGVGFWSAKLGLAAHRRKFRAGLGNTCAHCFYDLSATAEGLVCPECGGTLRYDTPTRKPGA